MSRAGRPTLTQGESAEQRPDSAGREHQPEVGGTAPKLILDQERHQHLGRAHEQQIGDCCAGQRRPQPGVPLHVRQAGAHLPDDRVMAGVCHLWSGRHRQQRGRGGCERSRVKSEGDPGVGRGDDQSSERGAGEAQGDRPDELVKRVRPESSSTGRSSGTMASNDGSKKAVPTPYRAASVASSHSLSAPVSDSTAIAPTTRPRATSAASITRLAIEAIADHSSQEQEGYRRHGHGDPDDRQRGRDVRQRVACQASATKNTPSPSRETHIPLHSSRKSRWRSGASRPTLVKPPTRPALRSYVASAEREPFSCSASGAPDTSRLDCR